ncbi:MAG: choice-of-anchor D domain-containing protein [bacterium]
MPVTTTTHKAGPDSQCEGDLCILVTPAVLHCRPTKCDQDVRIENTGGQILRVDAIEFDGDSAADFKLSGGCDQRTYQPGKTCTFKVIYSPSATGQVESAKIIINQNLNGLASVVSLEGDPATDPTDPAGPDLSVGQPSSCSVSLGDSPDGQDGLTIRVPVVNNGPGALPVTALVAYRWTSDTGMHGVGKASIDTGDTEMHATLSPNDYERIHTFTIRVDPDNQILESAESNNELQVPVTLPARPAEGSRDVRCGA